MRESGLKFIIFFVFSPNYRKGGGLCPPASCKSTLISFIAIGLMTDDFFAISMEEKKLYIVGRSRNQPRYPNGNQAYMVR